jgi:hypothetical protein
MEVTEKTKRRTAKIADYDSLEKQLEDARLDLFRVLNERHMGDGAEVVADRMEKMYADHWAKVQKATSEAGFVCTVKTQITLLRANICALIACTIMLAIFALIILFK